MISPDSIRSLPGHSVIIGADWAAYRLPNEGKRNRFWQVTGVRHRLTNSEMVLHVAQEQADGDRAITVVREGVHLIQAPALALDEIADDVESLLEDQAVRATYGLGSSQVQSVTFALREKFRTNHPTLARLLDRERER